MTLQAAALLVAFLAGGTLGGGVAEAGPPAGLVAPALVHYREAHDALARGDFALARTRFASLPADFLLADYAVFFAAEALVRAGDAAEALERFRAFPERFPDSTLVPSALLAAADTAFRLERWADAEREARRFLGRAPNHPEAGRVLVRLAEARAAQGLVPEALADLRRRTVESPASPWGEAAREIMEDLALRHGIPLVPLTGEEQLVRAQRLADASEVTAAVRAFEELLARESDPDLRQRALLRLAPALVRIQRRPDAVQVLQAALLEPATVWRPSLLYELARTFRRMGQDAAAVPVLERLLAEHPEAAVVPDAWLALARTQIDLGETEAARQTYQALLRAHANTPAGVSAAWERAWLEYRAHRFREAALAFRQLASVAPSHRLAGLYWAARALDTLPEKAAATALFREVVSRGPYTYYGILASRRIRGPLPAPVATAVRLPPDPIALIEGERHFQKGRALWRLGFEGHALVELERLATDGVVDSDRAYGLGVTFAQIGEAGRSLRYLRRAFGAVAEAGAPGLPPDFWRLFYPLGYPEIVKQAARRAGLDPYFVAAVIREESSYDPRARSWVGAVGLMQLMPETARVVAADAGLRLGEPAGLWEPPLNIGLGTRYLAQLQARFQDPRLVVAGYNAGPHRVQRWLAERRTADLEEFVDQIPFDETRGFVKRVYTSWHHYRRLYGAPERPPRRGEAEATPRVAR